MIAHSNEERLALAFGRRSNRASFSLLLELDKSLGRALQHASAPLAAQVRLAWWRDQIAADRISQGASPVLAGLAHIFADHEDARAACARMIDGWDVLLAEDILSDDAILRFARDRGGSLFLLASIAAQEKGRGCIEDAGALWALADFARHCSEPAIAARALALGRPLLGSARSLPRALRPFAILAYFAERDVLRGPDKLLPLGSPWRIAQAWAVLLGLA